jgi:hypothetical protein
MEHDGRDSPSPAGSPRGPLLLSSGYAAADALALAEEGLATYMCATSSSGAPNSGASLTTSSSVAPSAAERPLRQAGDKSPPTPADLLAFLAAGSVGEGPDGTGDGRKLFDALVADAMSEFRRDAVAEEESRRVKALELMEASLRTTASAAATPGSRSRGLRGKLRRAFTASHAFAGGSRSGSPYATAASSPLNATLATVASFSLLHLDASRTSQAHHFSQSPRKGVSPLRLPIAAVAGEASNGQSPAATLRNGSPHVTAKLGATTSAPSPRVAFQQPAKQNSPPAADLLGTFCAGAGSVVSSGASNRMAGSLHSQVLLQKRLVKRDVVPLRTPLALPAFYASRPKRHGQLVKQEEGIFLPPAAASCAAAGDTITTTGSALAAPASRVATADVPHARAATPNLESRCLYRTDGGDGRPRTPFSLLADLSQLTAKRSVWTPHDAMPRAGTPQSPPSPVEFAASSPSRRSGRPPARVSSQPRLSVQQRLQLHYSSEEAVIIAAERQREAHRLGFSLRDDASLLASTVRHQRADRPRAHSPYSAPVVPPRPTLSKV